MRQKGVDPPPTTDHPVDHEAHTSQWVDGSGFSSRQHGNGESCMRNTPSGTIVSSRHVSEYMRSLGVQDNINVSGVIPSSAQVSEFMTSITEVQAEPILTSGSIDVGLLNNNNEAFHLDISETTDPQIVAHLAPDEDDVEARITERVQTRVNETLQDHMRQIQIVRSNAIIADEVKDEPRLEMNKRSTWIVVFLVLMIGSSIGGVAYWLLSKDGGQQENPLVPSPGPSSSEASTISFDVLGPLGAELKPFIAPNEEDLVPFIDSKSPQSKALAWLQDDPIILKPGRSTQTVLERYVLAVLYFTTNGPSWKNYHLNRNDVCTWNDRMGENITDQIGNVSPNGVGCSSTGEAIESLIFPSNNLVGPFPTELILLTNLRIVNFEFNRLSGLIPTRISELTALEAIEAGMNQLSGGLPPTFSAVMLSIDLYENRLKGTLPESWGASMPMLQILDVSRNSIAGSLPTTIGQLSSLRDIILELNDMSGTVPSEMGRLVLLESLKLRSNSFTGSLPSELDQLSSLRHLDVAENSLLGWINEEVCGLPGLSRVAADCEEVDCPCCTVCCTDGESC